MLGLGTGGLAQARSEPWTDEQETGRHSAHVPSDYAIENGGCNDGNGPSVQSVLCVRLVICARVCALCVVCSLALHRVTVLSLLDSSTV